MQLSFLGTRVLPLPCSSRNNGFEAGFLEELIGCVEAIVLRGMRRAESVVLNKWSPPVTAAAAVADLPSVDDTGLVFLDEKGSTAGGNFLFFGIMDDDDDGRSLSFVRNFGTATAALTRLAAALSAKLPPEDTEVDIWRWLEKFIVR